METEEPDFQPRTALDPKIREELDHALRGRMDGIVRFTMVRHQGLGPKKESFRPVLIGAGRFWQHEEYRGRQVVAKNLREEEFAAAAGRLLDATGAREYHLVAASGDIHVRVTRKGRTLVSRSGATGADSCGVRAHDRSKTRPLDRFDSALLLRVLAIGDAQGRVKPSMQGKATQVNAFLEEIDALLDSGAATGRDGFAMLDCGCGRAYLPLAACCYLRETRSLDARVIGVDINPDVVRSAKAAAEALGLENSSFECCDLGKYEPPCRIDLLTSLHACDEATDMALAIGVRHGVPAILAAPCYQHELQKQLKDSGPFRPMMRHGILKERLADLLTDTFRAQILRIMGYRTRVTEFVSHDATARNIMIRAVKGVKAARREAVGEYLSLKESFGVVPVLEGMLGAQLVRLLEE